MSGVLVKKFGRKNSFAGYPVSSVRYVGQLGFGVAPGKIGVGLAEPGFGQGLHHFRPGEGFSQKYRLGTTRLDFTDQPFPERQRLGVRIIDAERAHPLADPKQHDIAQRRPQAFAIGVVEIDVDDVFVFLRRVLGIFDRAVGAKAEPLRMLAHPGVVGGALDRKVERHLHSLGRGGMHEAAKIGEGAEFGIDRAMPAFCGADRVRAARIARLRHRAVVLALAVDPADRMDWREIHHVEPQRGDLR